MLKQKYKIKNRAKFEQRNRCKRFQVPWLAGHHPRATMSFFPPGCELLLPLAAFPHLSTSFHCESLWYLWWSESEASIAPQSMANRLAESALVAMKIATSVRTQQCFLVLTPHFAVKRRGGQRPQIYPNFAYECVSTHIGHVRNHMTCTMTWSFSTSDLLILLLCRTLMPAPSARTASFWTRIFGVRQIVPLATTRQVSVIFSETALQFHLNIKMIPNAWSTKTSHGDSRGLIQHSSFCHYGHSKLCFRWAMERLGTPVRNARNIAETVSTVRRWELSLQALKTIQNHQWTQWVVYWTIQLCFMGSWPSTYSWPYKRLICPASWSNLERATKSWRFYTCGDHSWQESIW